MNPGRELDALVAEKVMGYAVRASNDDWVDGYKVAEKKSDFGKSDKVFTISGPLTVKRDRPMKNYSTSISAAWDAVNKLMRERFQNDRVGFRINFCSVVTPFFWMAYFGLEQSENYSACGDTAPHAICLAALKAVGHEFF